MQDISGLAAHVLPADVLTPAPCSVATEKEGRDDRSVLPDSNAMDSLQRSKFNPKFPWNSHIDSLAFPWSNNQHVFYLGAEDLGIFRNIRVTIIHIVLTEVEAHMQHSGFGLGVQPASRVPLISSWESTSGSENSDSIPRTRMYVLSDSQQQGATYKTTENTKPITHNWP